MKRKYNLYYNNQNIIQDNKKHNNNNNLNYNQQKIVQSSIEKTFVTADIFLKQSFIPNNVEEKNLNSKYNNNNVTKTEQQNNEKQKGDDLFYKHVDWSNKMAILREIFYQDHRLIPVYVTQ